MSGQGIGQPAHFPSTHGIGLAGQGEGPRSGLTHPACRQVTVNNRIAFIGAGNRLVYALGKAGDGARRLSKPGIKGFDILRRKITLLCDRFDAWGRRPCTCQCVIETLAVRINVGLIQATVIGEPTQQTVEQYRIRTWPQRQVKVRQFTGGGAAWINNNHSTPIPRAGLHTLVKHRMRPRGVTASQNQQVSQLQVLIATRNHVRPKGPFVSSHSRRHAKPGVGIYMRCANEPFGQLVGDVVVLGQQLARQVKGHRLWAVSLDAVLYRMRHLVQRLLPFAAAPPDNREQQPSVFLAGGFVKTGTFHTQTPLVRRVVFVPGHRCAAVGIGHHATAYPAIGAGGMNRVRASSVE